MAGPSVTATVQLDEGPKTATDLLPGREPSSGLSVFLDHPARLPLGPGPPHLQPLPLRSLALSLVPPVLRRASPTAAPQKALTLLSPMTWLTWWVIRPPP